MIGSYWKETFYFLRNSSVNLKIEEYSNQLIKKGEIMGGLKTVENPHLREVFQEKSVGKAEQNEPVYVRTVIEKLQRANSLFENLNNHFYDANARLGCAPRNVCEKSENVVDEGTLTVVTHINRQLDRFFENVHDYEQRMNELKEFV